MKKCRWACYEAVSSGLNPFIFTAARKQQTTDRQDFSWSWEAAAFINWHTVTYVLYIYCQIDVSLLILCFALLAFTVNFLMLAQPHIRYAPTSCCKLSEPHKLFHILSSGRLVVYYNKETTLFEKILQQAASLLGIKQEGGDDSQILSNKLTDWLQCFEVQLLELYQCAWYLNKRSHEKTEKNGVALLCQLFTMESNIYV